MSAYCKGSVFERDKQRPVEDKSKGINCKGSVFERDKQQKAL